MGLVCPSGRRNCFPPSFFTPCGKSEMPAKKTKSTTPFAYNQAKKSKSTRNKSKITVKKSKSTACLPANPAKKSKSTQDKPILPEMSALNPEKD